MYVGLPPAHSEAGGQAPGSHGTALIGGMLFPNLAPEVDLTPTTPTTAPITVAPTASSFVAETVNEPKKKKYAKEAWPGKKPTPLI